MAEHERNGADRRATSPDEPDELQYVVHHAALPQTAISQAIDRVIGAIGRGVSYVWLILVAVIVLNVTMRYAFGQGRIEFEEIQWHLYSIGFLVGLSYCLQADDHVRVDIVHERMGLRTRAWFELFGIVFLLLPFIALVVIYAVPFVAYSISINETSEAPGGLPARWAIKSFLFIGFALLAVAALSRLLRTTALLFGKPAPRPATRAE